MEINNIIIAFLLTIFAGLSTGIGSFIALLTKKTNKKFLSVCLGFSAGVMIYISFIEIMPESSKAIGMKLNPRIGYLISIISFFIGMIFIAILDKIIPTIENPHEIHKVEELNNAKSRKCIRSERCRKLHHLGIIAAIAIAAHNFPEGLAAFTSSIINIKIGIPIAIAIAIHNIPEGIAISVPVYYGTGNRMKAFYYSFLSGISEPIGALIGFFILYPFINNITLGIIFAFAAGIMVFISFDELLPTARQYGEHHLTIYGLISGMLSMSFGLFFLM